MKRDRMWTSAQVATSGVSLALLVWLAVEVLAGRTQDFDVLVRDAIHGHASPALTELARVFTTLGSLLFVSVSFVVAVLALMIARLWREAIRLSVVLLGAIGLENGVKFSVRRIRPEAFFGLDPTTYSFPSGHSLWSLCVYVTVAILLARYVSGSFKRVMILATTALLIVAVGLSRIYLGVHYPTDVIGGFLTAAFWLTAVAAGESLVPRQEPRQGLAQRQSSGPSG